MAPMVKMMDTAIDIVMSVMELFYRAAVNET